jgi:UDP-N-acetylmuramoyl-tripeptide--D-alanyl-D-alanine ligase
MPLFTPTSLASWTGGQWTALPEATLHGFTQDTRKLKAGQVFVALKTEKRDGHDFLGEALKAGASAALVSRRETGLALPQLVVGDPLKAFQMIAREYRRSFRAPVCGVTGSCGKTSTKNLLAMLLGGEPTVLSTEGNLNNHIGVPLTLTRLEPGAHEYAVIEAGISGTGEMAELAEMIQPDYGIVTLIAPAHTEELGGLSGVAREKSVLLQNLRPNGLGVFPKQCWDYAPFQDLPQTSIVAVPEGETISGPRSIHFSTTWSADATQLSFGRRHFSFRRVSRGMAQNAALAVVLASELGITDEQIQRKLALWQPAKWRGELRAEAGRTLYLDFYNANPASMADALENFISSVPATEPRVFVLGCMEELGPETSVYHRQLGEALRLRPQDHVFVIGSEAESVRAGAREKGASAEQVEVVSSLEPVRAYIAAFRGAVFVKGSRRYQLENALPESAVSGAAKGDQAGLSHGFAAGRPAVTRLPYAEFSNAAIRTGSTSFPFGR